MRKTGAVVPYVILPDCYANVTTMLECTSMQGRFTLC